MNVHQGYGYRLQPNWNIFYLSISFIQSYPAPGPGGGCLNTPFRFFADISKTAARSAAVFFFLYTCLYIFSAHVVKIAELGRSRSGHQVTSSDLTSEKVWMLVIATPNVWSSWNYEQLISVPVSIKCISQNFDIHDRRSGQFRNFSVRYKSTGEKKWKASLLEENHSKHSQTSGYR